MSNLRIRAGPPPITEVCPDCKGRMTVTEVRALLFMGGVENITYKCEKCRLEESWIFQSSSSRSADCPDIGDDPARPSMHRQLAAVERAPARTRSYDQAHPHK